MGVLCVALAGFVPSRSAFAVTQPAPDSTELPLLPSQAEVDHISLRGYPPGATRLQALFDARAESIDYVADAVSIPGTFTPRCEGPLTVELVLRASGCHSALAWYNATVEFGAPPLAQFYEIMPRDTPEM